ncbi:MAG: FAD-dependent oxidoreductase [Bacteroidota bacterium]
MEKLIIIGSGPAALTAAIYAARSDLNPLIIEGSSPGGQLMGTTYVENWPGTKKITGPELMMNMKEHAKSYGIRFKSSDVTAVTSESPFTVSVGQEDLKTEAIIIATGAEPKKLEIPGEAEYWGKGVTTCAVCDGIFYKDRPVIIVGGGDTAMENASFMLNHTKQITIVQILPELSASPIMQKRVLDHPDIKIHYNSTISKIEGDGNHVTSACITDHRTEKVETVKPMRFSFLSAINQIPNFSKANSILTATVI